MANMAPKKAGDRKRQTKINFSPASLSSPATKSSAPITMGTSPSTRTDKPGPSRILMSRRLESSSEDELAAETERSMRLGMPMGSTSHDMLNSPEKKAANSKSSEEEEGEEQAKPEPRSRKRRRATTPSESDGAEPTITVLPRKRRAVEVKVESSDEELRFRPHSKRRGKKERTPEKLQVRKASRSTRRKGARKSPTPDDNDCVDEDEEEEKEELRTPARSSRRRITRRRPSPSVEEEHSPPRSKRRRLTRRRSPSDEEEDTQSPPERHTRGESALDEEDLDDQNDSANDCSDEAEQEELKEELAFLRSSPLPDRGRLRSVHEKPKSKRQEALEALKRKRAGTNEPSSSATPGRRRTVVETDSDSELEVIKEEPDSDVEVLEEDDIEDDEIESDREANALDMFQEDHEDENFIDDDGDNVIGEPTANDDLNELRLNLSISRAKTKELFKHAVEWMVMKKIHPAFDSNKNVYVVTFRKLDDEVKGLAGSKYTSAAWTQDFTRALRARPDLTVNEIGFGQKEVMSPHCEACNRSNHPAGFELILQGQPYHPETLEPLANDSDSDSDSALSEDSETELNGEKAAYNFSHERIPPESHRFPLGSTCKANAQVAHTLYHWRYHLYQWVKEYLKAEGHLTAEKLVKRDGWSDRKREKTARKIVDRMEEQGQIRGLYHSYKDQVKAALEQDNEYANGWGKGGREGGGGKSGFIWG